MVTSLAVRAKTSGSSLKGSDDCHKQRTISRPTAPMPTTATLKAITSGKVFWHKV
jgi:hypothetical protein